MTCFIPWLEVTKTPLISGHLRLKNTIPKRSPAELPGIHVLYPCNMTQVSKHLSARAHQKGFALLLAAGKPMQSVTCLKVTKRFGQCAGIPGKKTSHKFGVMMASWFPIDLLGGGFKHVLFSPLLGEDSHFDEHIFQRGWFNHQPVWFKQAMFCYCNCFRNRMQIWWLFWWF